MDSWKWVAIDVGVILDTSASHPENFLFRRFSELGGGPLGHTSGCHQNLGVQLPAVAPDRQLEEIWGTMKQNRQNPYRHAVWGIILMFSKSQKHL